MRGPWDAPYEGEEVKVDIFWSKGDPAPVKEVAKRMLKLLDQELRKPAFKQRVAAAIAAKDKSTPAGGVDPDDQIDAEESATLEAWEELRKKVLVDKGEAKQPDIKELPAWDVDRTVTATIHARFKREREETKKMEKKFSHN